MNLTALLSFAPLRLLSLALVLLFLAGCSRGLQERSRQTYRVTIAVVLIPDAALAAYGATYSASNNEYDFATAEGRARLAADALNPSGPFPRLDFKGNWAPIVRVGGESVLEWLPQTGPQAPFTHEAHGLVLNSFRGGVGVYEENVAGQIACGWTFELNLTLSEPVNGSATQGIAGGSGGVLLRGRPDLSPMHRIGSQALWIVVQLDSPAGTLSTAEAPTPTPLP